MADEETRAEDDRSAEVRWLIDNSEGVLGLRIDGEIMPWADVIRCYLPSWSA